MFCPRDCEALPSRVLIENKGRGEGLSEEEAVGGGGGTGGMSVGRGWGPNSVFGKRTLTLQTFLFLQKSMGTPEKSKGSCLRGIPWE